MPGRRRAREIAVQLLFQADWEEDIDWDKSHSFAKAALEEYFENFSLSPSEKEDEELAEFVVDLVSGVLLRKDYIDATIEKFSKGWKIGRMANVDRNILRLGVFELCYHPDIPPKVAINEAVELAKKFGDANSPNFINGILDSVYQKACPEKKQLNI